MHPSQPVTQLPRFTLWTDRSCCLCIGMHPLLVAVEICLCLAQQRIICLYASANEKRLRMFTLSMLEGKFSSQPCKCSFRHTGTNQHTDAVHRPRMHCTRVVVPCASYACMLDAACLCSGEQQAQRISIQIRPNLTAILSGPHQMKQLSWILPGTGQLSCKWQVNGTYAYLVMA